MAREWTRSPSASGLGVSRAENETWLDLFDHFSKAIGKNGTYSFIGGRGRMVGPWSGSSGLYARPRCQHMCSSCKIERVGVKAVMGLLRGDLTKSLCIDFRFVEVGLGFECIYGASISAAEAPQATALVGLPAPARKLGGTACGANDNFR